MKGWNIVASVLLTSDWMSRPHPPLPVFQLVPHLSSREYEMCPSHALIIGNLLHTTNHVYVICWCSTLCYRWGNWHIRDVATRLASLHINDAYVIYTHYWSYANTHINFPSYASCPFGVDGPVLKPSRQQRVPLTRETKRYFLCLFILALMRCISLCVCFTCLCICG